ncbi:Fe-S cluster assembly protein SufB [Flexilinea flocculi]|uniref:Iron-regulated ABC transporter membrane component SufB n=1 Tax=Flexilinea flocculi TaxID=1678840 RepID=A0A0S7BPS7_9CHLR|nr:Fe-S cluster assembly protein SufB [Flexilinea flocculi]GAP40279.1 iron-regulated ABC transporter membrane component SufB [Flexilinea flocculi]
MEKSQDIQLKGIGDSDYQYGFQDPDVSVFKTREGLDEDVVRQISAMKGEPEWMLDYRLKGLKHFQQRPMPSWGPDLSDLDLDHLIYYVRPSEKSEKSWDEVPDTIKNTFDKLGIPEAEQKFLAGVGAQYESEMVYHSIQEHLEKMGVIFLSIEDGLRQYPDLFRKYFGTVVPFTDNKFAALNSAVWSGGSFVYIPKGVHVDLPLQAYFRLNIANIGQFERSLIIADEGSQVHYVEGCTAPQYTTNSFHSGVIEIIVGKNARVRYSTIQNWSTNVYNLVTQRAKVFENGTMEWVDSNLGSKITMKYPSCYLMEEGAHGEILSMAFAGKGQIQDAGSKMVHFAPNTSSKVTSKSISKNGGRSSYRGLVKIMPKAVNAKANVVCDALILHGQSQSDTYPTMEIDQQKVSVGHEASVSKIGEEQLFYLMSRGLSEEDATTMVVSGFIEPLVKELPMEYAVEMNRLIQIQMTGAVG